MSASNVIRPEDVPSRQPATAWPHNQGKNNCGTATDGKHDPRPSPRLSTGGAVHHGLRHGVPCTLAATPVDRGTRLSSTKLAHIPAQNDRTNPLRGVSTMPLWDAEITLRADGVRALPRSASRLGGKGGIQQAAHCFCRLAVRSGQEVRVDDEGCAWAAMTESPCNRAHVDLLRFTPKSVRPASSCRSRDELRLRPKTFLCPGSDPKQWRRSDARSRGASIPLVSRLSRGPELLSDPSPAPSRFSCPVNRVR